MLLLAAAVLASGSRAQAMSVPPMLNLDGHVIVSVSDVDGQGINLDLRATSHVYLDLSRLNGPFAEISLIADQGLITLHGQATGLWPHAGTDTQAALDTQVVSVGGDALIQPDSAWNGASFSVLAGGDIHVYGGTLTAGTITLEALEVHDLSLGGGDAVNQGTGGGITPVPLPPGLWLFGAALASLAAGGRIRGRSRSHGSGRVSLPRDALPFAS